MALVLGCDSLNVLQYRCRTEPHDEVTIGILPWLSCFAKKGSVDTCGPWNSTVTLAGQAAGMTVAIT